MNEFATTLIATIVSVTVSYFISNRNLSDSLDSKSGWREKLFTVASTNELTLDDAQTVRAALRIFPNFDVKVEQYSFTWFSNIMIVHLDKYILNKDSLPVVTEEHDKSFNKKTYIYGRKKSDVISYKSKKLNMTNSQFVRLFAMFLLKYHFDYRSSMGAKDYLCWFNRENKSKKYSELVEETYENYKKLLEKKERDMTNSDQTKPKESKDCILNILKGGLVFCSTLFTLLMILEIFFIYSNEKLSINVQFLGIRLGELVDFCIVPSIPFIQVMLVILSILAIFISMLSGMIVYKRSLTNDSNLVHTTEQDDLKKIWESIYNQENTQSN